MTQSLDVWMQDASNYLPGSVQAVVQRELILAAREFFERSYAWRESSPAQTMAAGDTEYDVDSYFATETVVSVLHVAFGRDVTSRPFLPPLPMEHPSAKTSSDPSNFYISDVPSKVKLWPEPEDTVSSALIFHAALIPLQAATDLPDIAADRYYDAIMDGLLARMMDMPGKSYSDKQGAVARRMKFMSAISRYRAYGKQGFAQAQNWSYPTDWGVRRLGQ